MVLLEDAQIRLFPVLFRQISENDCMVYRIGGAKITSVATSMVGAKAIRILREGKTIREVRGLLSRQLGIEEARLNLQPVLEAVVQARMVRQVDNNILVEEKPQIWRILAHSLQFAFQLPKGPLRRALIRAFPPGVSHRLLFMLARRPRPSPELRRNLDAAWGRLLPPKQLDELASRYAADRVHRRIDTHLLRNLSPDRMARWLTASSTVTGIERVQTLQRAGRGAILCGFHFGTPQLLVPLLWLHGLSFTGAAALWTVRGKILPPKAVLDNTYAPGRVPGCGTVTWYSRFSFRGFLEIMKAVEAGGTALVFPDGYFERPNREMARYFGHLAAEYKPSRVSVPFLGGSIQANSMVPWLWVETRASLFPVKVLRKSAATYEVMIEEPLELGTISSVQKAAEKIYAALERDIQLHPTQWDYWDRLHEITEPAHQESKEIAGTA